MTRHTALLIDDEPDILELLDITLSRMKIDCYTAANLSEAKNILAEKSFDLCLTDMNLPDGNVIDFVEYMQSHCPDTPIAVITAHGNVESAVRALKSGAFDFISKPIDLASLRPLVSAALKLDKQIGKPKITTAFESQLIGESPVMQTLRATLNKLARNQAPVLISGESGTGKELAAKIIHNGGPRSEQAFVPVNCGAIPSELMESEFFGHEKGSFTGATSSSDGLFRAATGGTLFLDEVADLPLAMQVKLLRAIQEKSVRPVGSQKEIAVDVRILSASHKNLEVEVREGRFRQDLFYRINVIEVNIPSLRQRAEDIPLLINYLIERLASKYDKPLVSFDEDAIDVINNYAFPGNIRELENIIERSLALCVGDHICVEDLNLPCKEGSTVLSQSNTQASGLDTPDQQLEPFTNSDKNEVLKALESNRWNKTAAAKALGISYRQLRYKLQKYGL